MQTSKPEGDILHISVCLNIVPDTDLELEIDPESERPDPLMLIDEINPNDLIALQEGLQCKDRTSGWISVFHIGSKSSKRILQRVLLAGVDEVHLVHCQSFGAGSRSFVLASLLELLTWKMPDLILCGAQSNDDMYGSMAAELAAKLNRPLVSHVMNVDDLQLETAPAMIKLTRLLAPGWTQQVKCQIPAVLSTAPYTPADPVELPLFPEHTRQKVRIHHREPGSLAAQISEAEAKPSSEVRLRQSLSRRRPTPAPSQTLSATERISAMYFSQQSQKEGVTLSGPPEKCVDDLLNLLEKRMRPSTSKRD